MPNDLLNKKYSCEMEVISPLHIGCGMENNWLKGIDFVKEEKKIRKLKLKQLSTLIGADTLSGIFVNRNEKLLSTKLLSLGNQIENVTERLFDFDYDPSDEIKAHIKDGLNNKPYAPGSSIKGALRSILFNHLRSAGVEKDGDVFGNAKDGDEFMRFIKISDAHFEKTSLMQAKIFNLSRDNNKWHGSWKHERQGGNNQNFKNIGFHTTFEIIPPEEKSEVQFMIADTAFDLFPFENLYAPMPHSRLLNNLPKKDKLIHSNIAFLFDIINQYTKSYIEKEIDFFKKYDQADYSEEIIEYLESLLEYTKEDVTSCLMRMASGSGFHSMTGDWRFETHLQTLERPDENRLGKSTFYKSRRIAFNKDEYGLDFRPMGFVLFTLRD